MSARTPAGRRVRERRGALRFEPGDLLLQAEVETAADWVEYSAWLRPDNVMAPQDLVNALKQMSSMEARRGARAFHDRGDEAAQEFADEVFEAIAERARHCGDDERYPFEVNAADMQLRPSQEESPYLFMLALTLRQHSKDAFSKQGSTIFELLSASVARRYLDSAGTSVETEHFGFPRTGSAKSFSAACVALGRKLKEGAVRSQPELQKRLKDASVDVVGWKPFLDRRPGKVIALGQCSTGHDWSDKTGKLDARVFFEMFFEPSPASSKALVPMFFVPRQIPHVDWELTCRLAGVVFDRCRMAALSRGVPTPLSNRIGGWMREFATEQGSS